MQGWVGAGFQERGGERERSLPDRDVERREVDAVLYVQACIPVDRAEKRGVVAEVNALVEERVAFIVLDVHVFESGECGNVLEIVTRAELVDQKLEVRELGLARIHGKRKFYKDDST